MTNRSITDPDAGMDEERILEFYRTFQSQMGQIHYDSPLLVGWSSKEEQRKRFEIFVSIGIVSGDSLLDYGCGLAHLLNYLKERQIRVDYHGIDISPDYARVAARLHPEARFTCCDIKAIDESYDWIIGSGVFTVGIKLPAILDRLDHAYRLSRKGMAFNFLNRNFNNAGAQDYFNTFDSQDMLGHLSDRFPNVTLMDEYSPQDFTIVVKK